MHSWRVLILPEMLGGNPCPSYDFQERWNGPNNSGLAHAATENFQCAVRRRWSVGTYTNYVLITGPGTVFPGSNRVSIDEITDGPENTIMAVHVHGASYEWMEPRDLTLAEIDEAIKRGNPLPIRGCHPEGHIYVIMADGGCQIMDESIPLTTLRALATIDGGEPFTQAQLIDQGYFHYPHTDSFLTDP